MMRSLPVRADSGSYDGTVTQRILILQHGSASASSELSLVKGLLENWGYPVEVFDYTEYYDLLSAADRWYLHDQGGGHGDLDLVVDGNMRYSVIIFDSGDGRAYTDVETSSRAVRQMFEAYPFLGIARMEAGCTSDGTMNNLFQITTSGNAAKSLTISNPMGIWALEPMVGYHREASSFYFRDISGKTSNVTALERFDDGTPALTLTSYPSGACVVYFSFRDWGYPAHASMLVRLVQQYSGIPYVKPYYAFEVDDCGDPEVNDYRITSQAYIGLVNWTESSLGGYPTLGFVEKFLDPDPPAGIMKSGLNPSNYSNNTDFNPSNLALMAALRACNDYVVASHGYQHNADWWQWTATSIPVDPYADQDGDGLLNWQDFDLEGIGVNNNDNPNLTAFSAGEFIEPELDMQERWFQRMRQVLDLYGYSDARVIIAPKFEYLDGYTNRLASEYGFSVISAKASNGFEMTLGWVDGTYAPGRVAPSGVGSDPDIALTTTQINSLTGQFLGYIGQQPLCLVTNHVWQFAEGDTPAYELRDSYLSSYGVITEAGFTLVSTQTATNKNIGWLWTDMSSVQNSPGSMSLALDSSAFLDGATRHELDIVMPYTIRQVKVGNNYCIYVDGNTLFYGKESDSTETLEVLSGAYDSSLPRISSVSTPATDVLKAIYDPVDGKISLILDGTFTTTLNIDNFNRPFLQGTASIGSDGNSALTIGLAGEASADSVTMSIVPSDGSVDVAVQDWNTSGDCFRQWTEAFTSVGMSAMHTMSDLVPGKYYSIWYAKDGESKTLWQTLQADAAGRISFDYDNGYSAISFQLREVPAPNQAPKPPTNALPANGAVGLSLTPTLRSSDFSDPDDGDTHVASQWEITAVAGDYSSPLFESQTDSVNLLSISVPADRLGYSATCLWRVRHQDSHGEWSSWSVETSFVTHAAPVAVPSVTTNAATNVATTSATVNGDLTALGKAGGVNVTFEWGTTTSYGSETAAQSMTVIGPFTANLSGLTANTTYHFRAKAVGHGSPVYGEDITFVTASLSDTTAPVISQVSSSGITKSGATITWTTNESATSRVEYGLTEEYGSFTPLYTDLVTSHSVGLMGLEPGKTYHFRVISIDAAGNQLISADNILATASRSGGVPAWGWVLIGFVAVAAAGGVVYLPSSIMGKQ